MTPVFTKTDALNYMRRNKLAVVSTLAAEGTPQAALVGVAATDSLQLIFDTVSTSRKHQNLLRDPRAAVTFAGPAEQTLQYQGIAQAVSLSDAIDEPFREAYYLAWPESRDHLGWAHLAYWRISPRWVRYSDYDRGPLIVEFTWDTDPED